MDGLCKLCGLRPIAPPKRPGRGKPPTRCAECRSAAAAKYSPEAQRRWSQTWQQKHPGHFQRHYQANRERILEGTKRWWRENALRSRAVRYGLTLEGLLQMVEAQEGCCPICGRSLVLRGKGGAQIDHEPGTTRVRGILCRQCNVGLGMFGDSPGTLLTAVSYLQTKT